MSHFSNACAPCQPKHGHCPTTPTPQVDVYGQDAGYTERAMVIYDGLHYDALAVAAYPGAPESMDTTVLPAAGEWTEQVRECPVGR